ncbi:hypothetical protein SEPCBS57363_000274 [Sporothrix epigloea]|uniref:F-box domain-containing protein n=1 Tax=Sporothrix epigloea TaxID=1892477 RepID=A0ABP0D6C2_9PEZI
MANFDRIPDELVVAILYLLPSSDIADSVQLLSRRFYYLSQEPKLWLARCRSDYKHWSAPFCRRLARAGPANHGPWKQMWINRRRCDASTAWHFEHVLSSKVKRVRHLEAICRRGLNAKDFLLEQYSLADNATDDVLARRYYASTALASIHRGLAVEEWCKVRADCNGFQALDRALGAFDMFVLHDGAEDMDRIEQMFDELADQFQRDHQHPSLDNMTVREKALALVRWIRTRRLAGMNDSTLNYRNVRNCLIGHALSDPDHSSLPIISSAIFVSIGERIGLRAFCCAAPGHVFVTVLGSPGESVDGRPLDPDTMRTPRPVPPFTRRLAFQERMMASEGEESDVFEEHDLSRRFSPLSSRSILSPTAMSVASPSLIPQLPFQQQQLQSSLPDNGERMFLDPFSGEYELSMQALREIVAQAGWGDTASRDAFMLPSPTSSIVLRTVLNLDASFKHANQLANIPTLSAEVLWVPRGVTDMNREALAYAILWATLLLRPLEGADWHSQVEKLMARIAHTFSEDAWIVQRYLLPLYERQMATIIDDDDEILPGQEDDVDNRYAFRNGNGVNAAPAPQARQHGPDRERGWARHLQEQRYQLSLTDPRVMGVMVYNLDQRQALVSRRYTQDIHDNVLYFIGQVFRHRRFDYIGIINGWSQDGPSSLQTPNSMSTGERASSPSDTEEAIDSGRVTPNPAADMGSGVGAAGISRRRKTVFYTCLRLGAERQVVAQRNIEIVTDPEVIPMSLMFLAGKNFKRFDLKTCTFVSNLREFFPDN